MPSPKKTAKGKPTSRSGPSQSRTTRSAIPRLVGGSKQLPSSQSTRIPSAGKRPHPSSPQGTGEASDPDPLSKPRAPKIPRTSAASASHDVDSRPGSPPPNGARPYPSDRRLPTPLLDFVGPSTLDATMPNASDDMDSVRRPRARNSNGRFLRRSPTPPPRDLSVKTEDMADEIQENAMDQEKESGTDTNGAAQEVNEEDYGSDYSCGWSYEEYTIPTQRGSPSPEVRYQRSFTKLGQRKPTPRRIILPNEGDLSAMAKTVYYEHDEDVVEPPSPSPNSRRRAVRAREREQAAAAHNVESLRILDGLDAPDDGKSIGEKDHPKGFQAGRDTDSPHDESGYAYDPRGFGVLEEIHPNPGAELTSLPESALPGDSGDAHLTQRNSSDISDSKDDVSVDFLPKEALEPLPRSVSPQRLSRASGYTIPLETSSQDVDAQYRKGVNDTGRGVESGEDDSNAMELTDESFDPDVVILKSGNPKAAAKAAAILRMHHPYVIEDEDRNRARVGRSQWRQERSPRRTSGQSRSRSRVRSQHFGDISMPDLIDEVEVELSQNIVRTHHAKSPSKGSVHTRLSIPDARQDDGAMSPVGSMASLTETGPPSQSSSSGLDPWTKDDWKNLERCFIQERKVIAQRMQLPTSKEVDPSHVDVELVVERFKGFLIAFKQFKSGPEWDRRKLVLRTSVLAKRLAKMMKDAQETPLEEASHLRETGTPSTFGDEYDYDRSLSLSRYSSVAGSSNPSGLYPQLHTSSTNAAHKVSSSSVSSTVTQPVSAHGVTAPSSTTSRLLGYLGLSLPSATPPPANAQTHFKQPFSHAPSTLKPRAESTALPAPPTMPEMSQLRQNGPITLVKPLRRASMGPMKDPEVRIMREREARPILRHPELPSSRDSSRSRSISNAPSQSPIARGLRSMSSSSSVRDLVRGFEELTGDGIQQHTPRSQSQSATPSPRARWSNGSSSSEHEPKPAPSGIEGSFLLEDRSFLSSNVREIIVPGRKLIPATAAPHKKRMSFLGPWIS